MFESGCQMLEFGSHMFESGCKMLASGCHMFESGYHIFESEGQETPHLAVMKLNLGTSLSLCAKLG